MPDPAPRRYLQADGLYDEIDALRDEVAAKKDYAERMDALAEERYTENQALRADVERLEEQARRQASLLALPVDEQQEMAHAYIADWQALRSENRLLQGELAHARALPEQLLTAIHWNEEQRDIQAKEIERLQSVDRNYQMSTADLLAEVERLSQLHEHDDEALFCGCCVCNLRGSKTENERLKKEVEQVELINFRRVEENERLRALIIEHHSTDVSRIPPGGRCPICRNERLRAAQYDRSSLVEVLVHHWPTTTSGCSCGWAVLGHSFPEHLADAYEAARES